MRKQQKMAINFNYNYPEVAREAGFRLRQYKDGPLDWRLMGSLEIERILREQSLEQIDAVLSHLSEAPIGSMLETNILDSGIAKYFILSQFSIQYLLFCRTFLDETVAELRESHAASQLEMAYLKKSLAEANNEILQLHKRMTQMEALHEVVFPCHLCTKNFVSNEALNMHISRKHTTGKVISTEGERCRDTPQVLPPTYPKDKENDLNLINTIKLELEIKQLKERLNQAEREIRERSAANSKGPTPRQQEQGRDKNARTTKRSVGIQSNLIEAKEQDESGSGLRNEKERQERNEQLAQMREQIRSFEDWREILSANNKESIVEINRKLSNIAETLEQAKYLRENHTPETKSTAATEDTGMQQRIAPSVKDLERLLSEKVMEIGKASAEKLEEVVYQMESNYRDKLEELESEIKNSISKENHVQRINAKIVPISMPEGQKIAAEMNDTTTFINEEADDLLPKQRNNDDTYEIEENYKRNILDRKNQARPKEKIIKVEATKNVPKLISQSTDSNCTFVKAADVLASKLPQHERQNESTDISSESLSEDEATQLEDASDIERHTSALVLETKCKISEKNVREKEKTKEKNPPQDKPMKPVPVTRKDVKKLVNKELYTFGLDLNTKTLSSAAMKKASGELADKRNKLKQKYTNFYVTRNKIRKFVDKLCSAKLPASAEFMLNSTRMLQPVEVPQLRHHQTDESSLTEHSFELQEPQASTPREERRPPATTSTDVFKQRLERILASPMHRPNADVPQRIIIDVHTPSKTVSGPVPLPRKRVMFNTRSSGSDSDAEKTTL